MRIIALILLLLFLVGCGQKGSLVLEDDDAETRTEQTENEDEAAEDDEAPIQ